MTFNVVDHDASTATLSQAILLYGTNSSVQYATIHPVETSAVSGPQILPGRPADVRALRRVAAELISSIRTRSGFLSENILSVGLDYVIWWSPPGPRTYYFDCARRNADLTSVGQRSGQAPAPGLIFAAKGRKLWVYAIKGNKRPTPDTPVFHAPLMNIYADGGCCTGSMSLPDTTLAEATTEWESSFWQSAFSHANHPKPVRYKGGIHAFSTDLLDGKFSQFPSRVLVPMPNITVQTILDTVDRA